MGRELFPNTFYAILVICWISEALKKIKIGHVTLENLFIQKVNNKAAYQPVHPSSLINTFLFAARLV